MLFHIRAWDDYSRLELNLVSLIGIGRCVIDTGSLIGPLLAFQAQDGWHELKLGDTSVGQVRLRIEYKPHGEVQPESSERSTAGGAHASSPAPPNESKGTGPV